MALAADITGREYGRLVALEPTAERRNRSVVWRCRCVCGAIVFVTAGQLGKTLSCGCWKRENARNAWANRHRKAAEARRMARAEQRERQEWERQSLRMKYVDLSQRLSPLGEVHLRPGDKRSKLVRITCRLAVEQPTQDDLFAAMGAMDMLAYGNGAWLPVAYQCGRLVSILGAGGALQPGLDRLRYDVWELLKLEVAGG